MPMKKLFNIKTLINFIVLSFVISAAYVSVRLALAPTVSESSEVTFRVKSDYALMLLQCLLGAVAMLLPGFLRRRIHLNIPSAMLIIYAVFLYCAIYLGEVRSFYFRFPQWDTMLHTFSGAALGALGFSLIGLLNRSKSVSVNLSPIFVALFAFCFAVSLGVIWEIYEFTADTFLHTNMQKFALINGELLAGRAALADTMKDLIVDTLGAAVMSVVGYFSLKHNTGWLERVQLKLDDR
jgi:hypothetical protein